MTLAQGLEEYYAVNVGKVTRPEKLDVASLPLFRNHDICHVIFGLDTTLSDEAIVDIRTLAGSDVGWRRYLDYLRTNPAAQKIFRELGYARSIWLSIVNIPRMLRAWLVTRRMPQRWPFDAPEEFLAQPIGALRERFGIRVI